MALRPRLVLRTSSLKVMSLVDLIAFEIAVFAFKLKKQNSSDSIS